MGLFKRLKKKKILKMIEAQNKKEDFYTIAQRFFDLGLLREIYSTEMVSICNAAESFYLAFPFSLIEDGNVFGLVIDVEGAKKIINDNYYAYELAYAYRETPKYIIPLNDKFIDVFTPIKERRLEPGCESPTIDVEFEKRIIKMQKNNYAE